MMSGIERGWDIGMSMYTETQFEIATADATPRQTSTRSMQSQSPIPLNVVQKSTRHREHAPSYIQTPFMISGVQTCWSVVAKYNRDRISLQKISKWTRGDTKRQSLLQDPVYGLGMGKRVAGLGMERGLTKLTLPRY